MSFARFTDGSDDGRNLLKLLWREIMGRLDDDRGQLCLGQRMFMVSGASR
jgi:hypothetical protein